MTLVLTNEYINVISLLISVYVTGLKFEPRSRSYVNQAVFPSRTMYSLFD